MTGAVVSLAIGVASAGVTPERSARVTRDERAKVVDVRKAITVDLQMVQVPGRPPGSSRQGYLHVTDGTRGAAVTRLMAKFSTGPSWAR
jgi:hypothetical protein